MIKTTIDSYGGPYADYAPVEDPETELAASYANRFLEDVAQMTRTSPKAVLTFSTHTNSTANASVITCYTQWGTGQSYYPVVSRTTSGGYSGTFATTFLDGLNETETVGFAMAMPGINIAPGQPGLVNAQATSYTFTVQVYSGSTGVESDLGGGRYVTVALY